MRSNSLLGWFLLTALMTLAAEIVQQDNALNSTDDDSGSLLPPSFKLNLPKDEIRDGPTGRDISEVDLDSLDPELGKVYVRHADDTDKGNGKPKSMANEKGNANLFSRLPNENIAMGHQLQRRELPRFMKSPYTPDGDGPSLLDISSRRISPREDLPPNYFNLSEFRSWRRVDDVERPNAKDWREKHTYAFCILGGVGKREVDWQPPLVRDFFEKNRLQSLGKLEPLISNFKNFWSKDPATGKYRSFSLINLASGKKEPNVKVSGLNKLFNQLATSNLVEKQEYCRQACQSCYDAAKETGAEQFLCDREEPSSRSNHKKFTNCRVGMVMGDPLPRDDELCVWRTQDGHNFKDDGCGMYNHIIFAQEGAPRNIYKSMQCRSVWPCEGRECNSGNDTVLIAEGNECYIDLFWRERPRWGLLGYQSLAAAMQDPSLRIYYTDMSRNPENLEKAVIVGSVFAIRPAEEWVSPTGKYRVLAEREMQAWYHYEIGDPVPTNWVELHHFNRRYDVSPLEYGPKQMTNTAPPGFGTMLGGTFLNASDPVIREHWRR